MTIFVGIDPGAVSGAVAAINERGRYIDVFDMPVVASGKSAKVRNQVNAMALANKLSALRDIDDSVLVALESVSAMPGQGVSSMFSLGDSFGAIRATVAIRLFPCELVSAATWKRAMGLNSDKEVGRAKAIRLFPEAADFLSRKKDHNRAEALLLAMWLLRKYA